jgi:CubicO group peptidase (beta-lactamase class C family)
MAALSHLQLLLFAIVGMTKGVQYVNCKRFHRLSMLLLTLLALIACQPIQPPSTTSTRAQTVSDQALGMEIDALLTKLNQEGMFNGAVLIAHNGQVVLRKGYGLADHDQQIPNTPTTRFRLASLTKQFTAMAILMLQEQRKLHVEDAVCQYIQDCPASWQTMTIQHLLTHTAGVYDFRDFTYTGQTPPAPSTSAQLIERIKEQPLKFAPGEDFNYTNGGFMVAGYIVEQVSGQSYEQFLQEHIFDPVGMENTGYAHAASSLAIGYRNATTHENPVDGSLPFAAAGLYSTVEDLYLYTQALETEKLLSQPSLDAFFGRHVRTGADNGGFSSGYEPPTYYAYGWGVATFHGHPVIGHDGWIEGYGGDVRRYPDDQITTILLMNQSEPWAALIGDQIAEVLFPTKSNGI